MSRQTAAWDPAQYGIFSDARARPFHELLARVDGTPRHIVDLGCGSGELTAGLAPRWPEATIRGIDSSAEMIDAAREHEIPGRLSFEIGDVATWTPGEAPDLIVSNAVFHWIPEHPRLLPRWIDALALGGWLAFQVPGNFDAPSHVLLRELCGSPRWRDRLAGAARPEPVLAPADYLDLLARHGCRVDAWETTYMQLLHGDDPVLEWVKSTALRPVLARLGSEETEEFLGFYRTRLREAYPASPHGTVFPFRRVFVVARRT